MMPGFKFIYEQPGLGRFYNTNFLANHSNLKPSATNGTKDESFAQSSFTKYSGNSSF
jgi:hypothetical protein